MLADARAEFANLGRAADAPVVIRQARIERRVDPLAPDDFQRSEQAFVPVACFLGRSSEVLITDRASRWFAGVGPA